MYWYVLFVQTGQEYKVEQFLKKRLDTGIFVPFVPLQEILFKTNGTLKKERMPLFPGYVFIESEVTDLEFRKKISTLICDSRNIISILKYSDTEIAMREHERQVLLGLSNNNNCVELSSVFIEGDRIQIIGGPLKGMDSVIKKVNRHKRQVWIEIEFMGCKRLFRMGFEIVEKC
ncbi:transcriptional antiterminator NusG [Anaerobacterium chartisolvens]|uniref:Transcriptional antiterminator NusG n=1 Tax=Anaerobacterium chartisolvens TaxID=1297424 RepID=A0A369BF71_9FIRM|nr:antiterminator LoaP [Anaerobacterium chartisolvens]RCX18344.1 transcriptional antiterminator NusG [Anaerobacterium chartisolvens]